MMTHLPQCAELVRLMKTTVRKLFVLPSVYQLRYGTWALQKRDARWTASVTFKTTWWGRNVHVNGVGRSSRMEDLYLPTLEVFIARAKSFEKYVLQVRFFVFCIIHFHFSRFSSRTRVPAVTLWLSPTAKYSTTTKSFH